MDSEKDGNQNCCHKSDDKFDEIDRVDFPKFDVNVTDAMANSSQVLHFPNRVSKYVLLENQQQIKLRDVETGRIIRCPIATSTRYKYERYISEGWNDYKLEKMLNAGDVLRCTIEDPPTYMNIEVIRR
ncbi:B3 DNA-binding domain protein [Trifolium medium]|uniref:B3 DNA-binding domain protein n=1 Tax=Trifolium medium TaxID=97028 RepID=A0A392NPF5_9FABA|nr:B3 DNA-binding domain protein [Trifolium medium]